MGGYGCHRDGVGVSRYRTLPPATYVGIALVGRLCAPLDVSAMMAASGRLLISAGLVLSLAACGQSTSTPPSSAPTAVVLGPPATSLVPTAALQQTAPTSGEAPVTTPRVLSTSIVAPTTAPQSATTPSVVA